MLSESNPYSLITYTMQTFKNNPMQSNQIMIGATKSPQDQPEQPEPRDTNKSAYIIHFLLGAGNLLPWNAFITAVDFFAFRYPNKHVEKTFSVAYMTSSLLSLLLILLWGRHCGRVGPRVALNLGFSLFILSSMVAPLMDWAWQPSGARDIAYGVTVASVAVCGLADGLVAASLMGSAGRLPKQYMQAVFAGTASSGVLVSMLRISTKALLPQNPKGLRASAHLYFLVSTMILLCCIICCNLLYKLPVMEQHFELLEHEISDPFSLRPQIRSVVRKIRWPGFGIFIIYIVTLSIFPGFIAENLESKLLKDWYPILLITVYNIADLVGKSLTAVYILRCVKKATWFCIARLLFYPLFTACLHGPKWLKTEIPMVFLTFMLGLTNGYLTSVMMIQVPKSVPASEAEMCAVVMVVFLGLGLAGGSVLGWFWVI